MTPARIGALVAVWLAFWVGLYHIDQQSLWFDEAWSWWAVDAPPAETVEPPRGARAVARTFIRNAQADAFTTLARVRDDVHPPLYFFLLDAFAWAAGESPTSLRYPSLLAGVLGVALTFTLGRTLYDPRTGVYAAFLLGTATFFVYYAREARMYALLMTLSAAMTLAHVRLIRKPTLARGALYTLLMTLTLYTQYVGALVPLAHGLHLLLAARGRWKPWLASSVTGALLFAPWVPILLAQARANPGGPLAEPLPTNVGTMLGLALMFTNGHGWWYGLAVTIAVVVGIIGRGSRRSPAPLRHAPPSLLVLWLLTTPIILLAANHYVMRIYQVRYTIAILPAWALLVGAGVAGLARLGRAMAKGSVYAPLPLHGARGDGAPSTRTPLRFALMIASVSWLAWLVYIQLTSFYLWPSKFRWADAVAQAAEARQPTEPALMDAAPINPIHYYDGRVGFSEGITMDLSWRVHSGNEARDLARRFDDAPRVWMLMPTNIAKTWHVASVLAEGRAVGYRDFVNNMVLYRFDHAENAAPLEFTFGDEYAFTGNITQRVMATADGETCLALPLAPLAEPDGRYSAGLAAVRGHDEVVAQWDGDPATETVCLALPPGEDLALFLAVYDWRTGQRLHVLENGAWWGDFLVAYSTG